MGTEGEKSVEDLEVADLVNAGLTPEEARFFLERLRQVIVSVGYYKLPAAWDRISKTLLTPEHPHALHQLLYLSTYKKWDPERLGPPPGWLPSLESTRSTNLGRMMETYGEKFLGRSYKNPIESFSAFQKWSADHPEIYLETVFNEYVSLVFHKRPTCILDTSDEKMLGGTWLPGAVMNVADSALSPNLKMNKSANSVAIVWRDEGADDLPAKTFTYAELRKEMNKVANALVAAGFQRGDAIGIDMPMNIHAVVAYLAIVLAGMVVVSIADSFVAPEIATRCRVSQAKGIITQDHIMRGSKLLPLYSRVMEAKAPRAIVIPANGNFVTMKLRDGDLTWAEFLCYANNVSRPEEFQAVAIPAETTTNILFSSGTTGEPKAIPWTHLSPLRCGVDAWAHQDVRPGDVIAWPTNLGWMMGPFLIYAALLNGGTMALYNGSPLGRGYAKFVQDVGITIQGTVPSLVKTWRNSGCTHNLDWSNIREFSSTGEASSLDDDLWLSSRTYYKAPVLECCGGTELASAYVGGSLLQPQAYAAFSTASLMNEFVLLDDNGNVYPADQPCIGEIGLVAINFGASNRLLNADHEKVYYTGMSTYKGKRLRRHGDIFERTPGGYYRAHGRSDDTMNLGGIKASAVEIERVCNTAHESILETAALAISPPGGGPEQLFIMIVLKEGLVPSLETCKKAFSTTIQKNLNPLFKVSGVEIVSEFPRTASNKLLRRVLRAQLKEKQKARSKL
ncbi:unnamed protein product [Calypogeia fissa]